MIYLILIFFLALEYLSKFKYNLEFQFGSSHNKLISEVLVYINNKDNSADWFSSTFYTFFNENLINIEIYEKVNDILNTFDKPQRLSFLSAVRGILMEIRATHYPEISMQSLTKIKEILGVFEIEWDNETAYKELINIWENQKKEMQRFT